MLRIEIVAVARENSLHPDFGGADHITLGPVANHNRILRSATQALQSQKVTHHLAARLGMTQEGTYYSVMQAYPSHFTLIRRVPEANLNLYQFHP